MTILAAFAFAAFNTAYAGLLGDEVQARWIFAPFFDETRTFVVGAGTELVGTWGSDNNLDVGDNYIEATFPNAVGVGFGPSWHFTSLDFGGIGGFFVSTNFQGWEDSWLSFTSDSIDIAFLNQVQFPFGEGYIRITLLPAPVSEPASLVLLLLGLTVAIAYAVSGRPLRRSRRIAPGPTAFVYVSLRT